MTEGFAFFDVGPLRDRDLELVLVKTAPANPAKGHVPAYMFEMRRCSAAGAAGRISLRIGTDDRLTRYAGHIGYNVAAAHRGNRLAARSVRLLLPLAKRHGIDPLWITCNPDNPASRRTCELAGGSYIETVDVPEDDEIHRKGDHRKCRYRFDLST